MSGAVGRAIPSIGSSVGSLDSYRERAQVPLDTLVEGNDGPEDIRHPLPVKVHLIKFIMMTLRIGMAMECIVYSHYQLWMGKWVTNHG